MSADIFEKCIASNFRDEEQVTQDTSMKQLASTALHAK
jgi:hypothetical protein